MTNIFNNYKQQKLKEKELIIILNNNNLKIDEWKKKAEEYPNVLVYQLDETESLGACLNFGVEKASFDIIAKFDDDDYYGPKYLKEAIKEFDRPNVSIVGKRCYYIYLEGPKMLRLLGANYENIFVNHIAGASLIVKKEVIKKIQFRDLSLGTDTDFLKRCKNEGYKLYSTNKNQFAIIRRNDIKSHTWKITEKELIKMTKSVPYSDDFRVIVDQKS